MLFYFIIFKKANPRHHVFYSFLFQYVHPANVTISLYNRSVIFISKRINNESEGEQEV